LFVIFGPSRSGKSTLLRLLNRLSDLVDEAQREGNIAFDGRDIFAPEIDVTWLRREISMVFAIPTPLPGTVYENMTYGLEMAGMKDRAEMDARVERGRGRPRCGIK
jgi:phosphate transport system ATP-binding protein